MIQHLLENLPQRFPLPIKLLNAFSIPSEAYDLSRHQYLSTELLKTILRSGTSEALKISGITEVDLFIPVFTYVFGEAQLGGKVSLVSLHRLRPEFYGDSPNKELYKLRILKEAVHELGHTFGLVHCPEEFNCVMSFSNTIYEIDKKKLDFCPSCQEALKIEIKKQEL